MSNKRKLKTDDEEQNLDEFEYMSDEEGGIRIHEIYIPPPPKQVGSYDFNGPRLIIKKIINTNFKSYGEQQILGPFHKVI